MLFIGLTGGVAAGKSTALTALAEHGIPTLSADDVVHRAYESPELLAAVAERLGDDCVVDGRVDRDAVARAIFAEPEARSWLEQLIWPIVGQEIIAFRDRWRADGATPAAVVEVPLLFESGMDQAFDRTIAIVAPDELRAERAGQRGHEAVAAREERQLAQAAKAERADAVVENAGSREQLGTAVLAAIDSLSAG